MSRRTVGTLEINQKIPAKNEFATSVASVVVSLAFTPSDLLWLRRSPEDHNVPHRICNFILARVVGNFVRSTHTRASPASSRYRWLGSRARARISRRIATQPGN